MRNLLPALLLLVTLTSRAQLTVEKIMKDQKWIGSSPSGLNWAMDSKSVLFNWNPERNVSDSVYAYTVQTKSITKANYNQALQTAATGNGSYNTARTQLAYAYRNDIFLLDIKTNKTTRITQTEDIENNARFAARDQWIVFNRNQNLYAWDLQTGVTRQLTNFARSTEPVATAGARTGATGNRTATAAAGSRSEGATPTVSQEQWLKENQLTTSDVLKQRQLKRAQRDSFLKSMKIADTVKAIAIGDRLVQGAQVSPNGRFVTYRLTQSASNAKTIIVPDYVTESGYTTDIPGRTKVGAPTGRSEFFVFDREQDSVLAVATDSLPGIMDVPDYMKDYPQKFAGRKPTPRAVVVTGINWNESGSRAIVDIRSQDNKDRWIMELDPARGKLKAVDRQRDEAWIGGPGVSGFAAKIGWINDNECYFQSEATGYSHLYSYNFVTALKKQLTTGNYEVQDLVLSKARSHFYLLSNEEHPGKQHWYRIKTDGSGKEKITTMTGGYEVSMSPDETYIAYRYSYINRPPELYIQENAAGKKAIQVTDKGQSEEFKAYPWRDTKIFTITARDGQPIHARVFEPPAGKKNNAAVIFVHGAGYLQNVEYWWSSSYPREYMFNNLLADKGYTVIDIDYRGSAGYGRNWRTGIYRYMGGKDLDDEVDAARYLVKEMGIDSNRIGMYGGSYGGFMGLMAMFTQPGVFKAAAALRPVTDWAHYNHGYTSNILNEPFNDSIAYARSSPINFAAGLKDHLLICHGMVDVNVNFQDAVRLNQRLIELGKENWELAVYPLEDHAFVEPSSWTDEYKRILKLFETTLR
ncbi:S9 family peptidase [Segetibacter sp. 3557_3]|uniref:S9 family peptidase n=1 Tax=Segetibacter sp. 3557_3 TaxID=2547429 RepID=UPI0010586E34|nr:prolyl oligopeptidase family serine peptidase [Segetibacter sp. 3557_3]TDH28837.1 S9 family peptidase [Segetibacter sp. 3557_3]